MRLPPPTHNGDIGPRFKVKILWPMFLYQVAVLRSGLAFFDSQKQHQANAYWLEYIAEASVTEAFGTQAPAIFEQLHRLRACAPAGEPIALHGRMALFYNIIPAWFLSKLTWSIGVTPIKRINYILV